MKTIVAERNSGKTTELIKMSSDSGDSIVCYNQKEALGVYWHAIHTGYEIPFPLTYDEFIENRYLGKWVKGFLIDNVDMLLDYMTKFRVPIRAITVSKESVDSGKILDNELSINERNQIIGSLFGLEYKFHNNDHPVLYDEDGDEFYGYNTNLQFNFNTIRNIFKYQEHLSEKRGLMKAQDILKKAMGL
jgi:hypothetical protein